MRRLLIGLVSILLLVLAAGPVAAGTLTASIDPSARLIRNDVQLRLTIECEAEHNVREAFVYVTQDGEQTGVAPIPLRCGSGRTTYIVRIPAGSATLEPGNASASAYILVEDVGTGQVHSISPAESLILS